VRCRFCTPTYVPQYAELLWYLQGGKMMSALFAVDDEKRSSRLIAEIRLNRCDKGVHALSLAGSGASEDRNSFDLRSVRHLVRACMLLLLLRGLEVRSN
jgi:hypothetical protein